MRGSERKEEAPESLREVFLEWMEADWEELPVLFRGLLVLSSAMAASFLALSIIVSVLL